MDDHPNSSLIPFETRGTYRDALGSDAITWAIARYVGTSRRQPSFEIRTTIRGVDFAGFDFDGLERMENESMEEAGVRLDAWRNLTGCVLTEILPSTIESQGQLLGVAIEFELDLRSGEALRLHCAVDNQTVESTDAWFKVAMLKLGRAMPAGTTLSCCISCSFSDYSPGGHGLTEMSCHRQDKEQYLAVRRKLDHWSVPATEEVIETHRGATNLASASQEPATAADRVKVGVTGPSSLPTAPEIRFARALMPPSDDGPHQQRPPKAHRCGRPGLPDQTVAHRRLAATCSPSQPTRRPRRTGGAHPRPGQPQAWRGSARARSSLPQPPRRPRSLHRWTS